MRNLEEKERLQMEAYLAIKRTQEKNSKRRLHTAIYARKSSDDIHQTSLPTQIHDCREFIEQNKDLFDLQEKHIYQDEARSGMFVENREQFQEMLKEVRNGKIEVIVLYHHERLTRKIGDFDTIKKELERYHVFLVFGDVYYDKSPMGKFFANISFSMAQFDAETAAHKTVNCLRLKAESGQSAGGRAPYGLKNISKVFDIEQSEAPAVKLMFDIVANDGSYGDIEKAFDDRGIRTRSGGKFSKSTISDMLRNWKYAGIYVYCRKDKNGNPVNKKRFSVYEGEQPEIRNDKAVLHAIVSKEKFLKVQKILDEREQKGRPKQNAHADYLLSGLVRCENGERMSGESSVSGKSKKRYRYYSCGTRRQKTVRKISADILETFTKKMVAREVQSFIQSENFSTESLKKSQRKLQADIGELSRKVADTEKMNANLTKRTLYAQETVAQQYEKTIEDNLQLIKSLNKKIESLTMQKSVLEKFCKNPKTLSLSEQELFGDIETTREIIRIFVKEIVVSDDDICVNLY